MKRQRSNRTEDGKIKRVDAALLNQGPIESSDSCGNGYEKP